MESENGVEVTIKITDGQLEAIHSYLDIRSQVRGGPNLIDTVFSKVWLAANEIPNPKERINVRPHPRRKHNDPSKREQNPL